LEFTVIAWCLRQIRSLEDEIDRLATETYPHTQLLTQVPGVSRTAPGQGRMT
jgi:hypothetical protein